MKRAVVGLTVVYPKGTPASRVFVDRALSQPTIADDAYLYGVHGPDAIKIFCHQACLADPRLIGTDQAKILLEIGGENWTAGVSDGATASRRFLSRRPQVDLRRAFQDSFFDEVVAKHGDRKRVKLHRANDSEQGFREAMLAYPDCIAPTMAVASVVVAILPMRVKFGLDLQVTIVAKSVVEELLREIEPSRSGASIFWFTDANGEQKRLTPPVLPRPVITFAGRAGARWRRGTLHPDSSAVNDVRASS